MHKKNILGWDDLETFFFKLAGGTRIVKLSTKREFDDPKMDHR